jgi:hypothetical protein
MYDDAVVQLRKHVQQRIIFITILPTNMVGGDGDGACGGNVCARADRGVDVSDDGCSIATFADQACTPLLPNAGNHHCHSCNLLCSSKHCNMVCTVLVRLC